MICIIKSRAWYEFQIKWTENFDTFNEVINVLNELTYNWKLCLKMLWLFIHMEKLRELNKVVPSKQHEIYKETTSIELLLEQVTSTALCRQTRLNFLTWFRQTIINKWYTPVYLLIKRKSYMHSSLYTGQVALIFLMHCKSDCFHYSLVAKLKQTPLDNSHFS